MIGAGSSRSGTEALNSSAAADMLWKFNSGRVFTASGRVFTAMFSWFVQLAPLVKVSRRTADAQCVAILCRHKKRTLQAGNDTAWQSTPATPGNAAAGQGARYRDDVEQQVGGGHCWVGNLEDAELDGQQEHRAGDPDRRGHRGHRQAGGEAEQSYRRDIHRCTIPPQQQHRCRGLTANAGTTRPT
jgi:hypothetical protein